MMPQVSAIGRRDGREARCTRWPSADWWISPGALATSMLKTLRGEIGRRTIPSPEARFEPVPFFAAVACYGSEAALNGKL